MTAPTENALAAGIGALTAEAGGIVQIQIIHPDDAPFLLLDALAGDSEALRLLAAVETTVAEVANAPRRTPKLCVTCPAPIRAGDAYAVGIVLAYRNDPHAGIGFAVCQKCCKNHADLAGKAAEALKSLWPDLRRIEISEHQGGRA